MSDTPSTILIAVDDPTFGAHLQSQLQPELNDKIYQIQVVTNCQQVDDFLARTNANEARQKIGWLIIQEDLVATSEGTTGPNVTSELPSFRVAQKCLSASSTSRCIILTHWGWEGLPTKLNERLLGLPFEGHSTEKMAVTLADMIDAGDENNTYMMPLVLDVELQPPSEHDGEWLMRFRDFDRRSPFTFWARGLSSKEFRLPKPDFAALPPCLDPCDDAAFKAINQLAHDIGDKLFMSSSGFPKLVEILRQINVACWKSSNREPPPFIHLHFQCPQEGLVNPLEIALGPKFADQPLASLFPIVWNLTVKSANQASILDGNQIRVWNQSREELPSRSSPTKGHFAAATSCGKADQCAGYDYKAIPDNAGHIDTVSSSVRWEKSDELKVLANRDDFVAFLKAGATDCRKRRYLLTHGLYYAHSPGLSGVIIDQEHVTIDDMKQSLGNQTLAFFFLNCCELGQQASTEISRQDFYGGFVAGAIARNITAELITNRWQAETTKAKELAVHFYRSHPRTTHSRATALFHARNHVRSSDQRNLTWLAPVHAIRGREE